MWTNKIIMIVMVKKDCSIKIMKFVSFYLNVENEILKW